jgi:hypothetical protein
MNLRDIALNYLTDNEVRDRVKYVSKALLVVVGSWVQGLQTQNVNLRGKDYSRTQRREVSPRWISSSLTAIPESKLPGECSRAKSPSETSQENRRDPERMPERFR